MDTFETLAKPDIEFYPIENRLSALTTQHVSGMRMFREIKLCARARNVPILDGLDFIRLVGVAI